MKFFHVIRNAPDWLEISKDYDKHDFNEEVKGSLAAVRRDWKKYLRPGYFEFRNDISKIAWHNFNKLTVDHRWLTATQIEKELAKETDKYIAAFSDDDDWYRPDLPDVVKKAYEADPDLDAIIWKHSAFCNNFKVFDGQPGAKTYTEPFFIINDGFFFHTNNYVLTDTFFKKLTPEDIHLLHYGESYDLHYGHTIVDHFMKQRIKTLQLNEIMSMANKNITSYSYFLNHYQLRNTVKDLVDVVAGCQKADIKIQDELKWAEEEIRMMIDLYKKMKINRIL